MDDPTTFEFDQDGACLRSAHRGAIEELARRVLAERIEGVSISGPSGASASLRSRALGLERARAVATALRQSLQRLSPGSERRLDIALASHPVGAAEHARHEGLVATVRFRQAASMDVRVFDVTVESLAESRDEAVPESGLFLIASPGNDSRGLFSRAAVRVCHRGTRLVSLSGAIGVPTGSEETPPSPPFLLDAPFLATRVDGSRMRFGWAMKLPGSVWHRVEGIVDCSSAGPLITLLTADGSDGLSHRARVDGNLRHDAGPRGTNFEPWAASRFRRISA